MWEEQIMASVNEQEIVGKVKKMVASQLGKSEGEISIESAFIEDLGADSLDLVELIMAMEDEFGLEISDEEAERIVTVQDAINHILEHKK
jgi:acyl carrier protein